MRLWCVTILAVALFFPCVLLAAAEEEATANQGSDIVSVRQLVNNYLRSINHSEANLRERSVQKLNELGAQALPFIIEHLESKNNEMRTNAIFALGNMNLNAKEVVPALLKALNKDEATTSQVLEALDDIGQSAIQVFIVTALEDEDPLVRETAIFALSRKKAKGTNVVLGLSRALLRDKAREVRGTAARTLGEIQPEGLNAREASRALSLALKDNDARVRRNAVVSLGKIGVVSNAVFKALADAADDKDVFVRREVAVALGSFGPRAKKSLTAVKKLLEDEDEAVRKSARLAMRRICGGGIFEYNDCTSG